MDWNIVSRKSLGLRPAEWSKCLQLQLILNILASLKTAQWVFLVSVDISLLSNDAIDFFLPNWVYLQTKFHVLKLPIAVYMCITLRCVCCLLMATFHPPQDLFLSFIVIQLPSVMKSQLHFAAAATATDSLEKRRKKKRTW